MKFLVPSTIIFPATQKQALVACATQALLEHSSVMHCIVLTTLYLFDRRGHDDLGDHYFECGDLKLVLQQEF